MKVMFVGTEDGFADSFMLSPEKKQSHQVPSLIQVTCWIWFKCAAASANSLSSTISRQEPMVRF
jgi:hypothetical protein